MVRGTSIRCRASMRACSWTLWANVRVKDGWRNGDGGMHSVLVPSFFFCGSAEFEKDSHH